MAPDEPLKSAQASKDELAVISNRLAIAMAKREALVKSWTASTSRLEPEKTQEEMESEDAALFRREPAHLGVGAAIPAHFLANEFERGKKALRAKLLTTKGLKASKPRDTEEKAASAKRAMREQSSDEEEGRSSLGRAKKMNASRNTAPIVVPKQETSSDAESDGRYQIKAKKRKIEVEGTKPAKAISKGGLQNKALAELEKAKGVQPSNTKYGKAPAIDSTEDDERREAVTGNTERPTSDIPSGVSKQKAGQANLKKEDGMDAKERRRLKKKEKKKLKKLGELEVAAEA